MRKSVKQSVRDLLGSFGYSIIRVPKNYSAENGYVLYDYRDARGIFDYEKYKALQVTANKKKIKRSYAKEENINFLAELLRERLGTVRHGICHGTRRGLEQTWFRAALNADVVGTEISETATQFPHTIEWDFHEVKAEWLGHFDFIYSNSFDHSYDPERCLNAWMSCLKVGGICVIEHSQHNGIWAADARDPFGAELQNMPYLIICWGRGKFAAREIIDVPSPSENVDYHSFILIQNLGGDWHARI